MKPLFFSKPAAIFIFIGLFCNSLLAYLRDDAYFLSSHATRLQTNYISQYHYLVFSLVKTFTLQFFQFQI